MQFRAVLWLVLFASLTLAVFAQTSRGTVSGVLTDANGAVIAGANVVLTNTETTVSRTTVTNGEGFYRFDAVDLGTYTLKFSASSFATLTKSNIVVSANQTATVDAQLAPGTQEVSVDITAVGPGRAIASCSARRRASNRIATRPCREIDWCRLW